MLPKLVTLFIIGDGKMNNTLSVCDGARDAPAAPTALCYVRGGTDEPHIRYYRLASGQSENYLANQACRALLFDMVRQGKRTARYKFCRALITSLVPMHPHLSSACTAASILYARQSRLPQRMHRSFRHCSCRTSTPRTSTCSGCWTAHVGRQAMASLEKQGPYRFKLFLCRLPVLLHDRTRRSPHSMT